MSKFNPVPYIEPFMWGRCELNRWDLKPEELASWFAQEEELFGPPFEIGTYVTISRGDSQQYPYYKSPIIAVIVGRYWSPMVDRVIIEYQCWSATHGFIATSHRGLEAACLHEVGDLHAIVSAAETPPVD